MVVATSLTPWECHKQCHPNQVALSLSTSKNSREDLTWQQLCDKVAYYQASLAQQGMKAGDVLTLVGKNHPEMIFWLLAAFQHGVMCAFVMPQPLAQLATKLETLYLPEHTAYIWFPPHSDIDFKDIESFDRPVKPIVYQHNARPVTNKAYQASNLATIIFTSGSTGVPKAVAHGHSQHFASAQGLLEAFRFDSQDCWLLSLPLYHVSGLAIVYRWLQAGACLKVGTGELANDIQGVSHASLVPTQLKRLLDSEQTLTLTHVLLGGSHIPHSLAQQAAQLGIETWLGYGMTEAASTVTAKQVDQTSTAGCLLPRRALKIENNIVFIAGDTLAQGYYCQGQLHPLTDEDGWFNSKDLGQWQKDELVITGRADNLFISGGENVHCEEIEAVLNQHADVELAMVIPVKDEEFGARPIAVIRSDNLFTQHQCDHWCKDKLEKFKWPIDCFEMPNVLSETGIKVSRSELKKWFFSVQTRYKPLA